MDEMELVSRFGAVDPLPPEALERAEGVLRAAMAVSAEPESVRIESSWWSRRRVSAGIAAAAVIAVGAGAAWGLSSDHDLPAKSAPTKSAPTKSAPTRSGPMGSGSPSGASVARHPKMILTAAEVHTITAHSASAAASSGTAQVTETSVGTGALQQGSDESIAVTFDGNNIDEKITTTSQPAGSAPSFTTDDRLVDGQFYIYTPGPNDVPEWMHDTGTDSDSSMSFPDPRTLYGILSPSAQFQVAGTSNTGGETLTELEALDPGAIDAGAFPSLAQGTVSSFEMWVNQDGVVQKMTVTSSQTEQVCSMPDISPAEQLKNLKAENATKGSQGKEHLSLRAPAIASLPGTSCGPQTIGSTVTVAFANLGDPESVVAPRSAVDFQGKG